MRIISTVTEPTAVRKTSTISLSAPTRSPRACARPNRPTGFDFDAACWTSPPSPGRLIAMGFGLVGVAVVVTVATVVALDRVYPIWVGLIALAGIANIGCGLALRRR